MAARNRRGVGESNPQREKKKATSLSARDIPNALRPRDQGNQPVVAKPQTKAPAVRASAVVRQGQTPFQTASIQSPRSSIEGGRTSPRSAAIQTAPRFMPPPPPASFPRQQPALPLPPAQPGSGGATPLIDGQTVTALGPFTFDRATVAKCQAACTVVFSGPMGSVTGRFFKTVWGPILLEKNGPVRLSGLVKKSGTSIKIIVSDIQ